MNIVGPYQVDSNSPSKQEAQVDVDGVVLVLNDPGQTAYNGTDNKGEDEEGLQQLGRVCQSAVEVHLWTEEHKHIPAELVHHHSLAAGPSLGASWSRSRGFMEQVRASGYSPKHRQRRRKPG